MSDYSGVAPPTNFSQSSAFAAALQRARQIAAKINPGSAPATGNTEPTVGQKRPLEEGSGDFEPDSKKVATGSSGGGTSSGGSAGSGGATVQASAATAAVAARVAGAAPPGIQGMGAVPGLNGSVSSEDIKVPDKMVGLIIGRGGEQISRLQSESGCKIQMALDSGGAPERLCTLTGNPQAISRAKEMIGSIISQRSKTEGIGGARLDEMGFSGLGDMGSNSSDGHMSGHGGHSDMDRGSMMSQGPGMQSQGGFQLPTTVEIMVPGVKVGLIIGKGGETIKQLQEKSGTKMVVVQDGPSQENEKPLRISGDPQKVEHAKSLVYDLISDKDGQRRDDRRGGGRMGFDRGGGRDRGGRGGWGSDRGDQQESTFVVPASKCGIIIGRGGETIKQINQSSGAHCELDRRSQANPTEKTFLIRGQPDQIETAKRMIAEKLGSVSGQDQNGGGPQFGSGMPPGGPGGGPGGPHFAPQNWGGSGPQGFQQPWGNPQQPHPQDPNMFAASQNSQVQMNPQTGQPDYSTQWAEYYRSVGMHREAELIEQQAKANKGMSAMPQAQPGQQTSQPAGANTQGAQNGQPDYSAQWAEYYRSTGKIKEAEFIEQQMKSKQAAVTPGAGPQPAVGMPNPYTQPQPYGYGAAAAGFYGASQPPAGQPGQPQYPGYPGYAQAYHMQAPGQSVPPDGQ